MPAVAADFLYALIGVMPALSCAISIFVDRRRINNSFVVPDVFSSILEPSILCRHLHGTTSSFNFVFQSEEKLHRQWICD
jgi:hypothetical protein